MNLIQTDAIMRWLRDTGWLNEVADIFAEAMVKKLREAGAIPPAREPPKTLELPVEVVILPAVHVPQEFVDEFVTAHCEAVAPAIHEIDAAAMRAYGIAPSIVVNDLGEGEG